MQDLVPCDPAIEGLFEADFVELASQAATGLLKVRSADAQLNSVLGPEISECGRTSYQRSLVLSEVPSLRGQKINSVRVEAGADHDPDASFCSAYGEVSAGAIDVGLGARLRVQASSFFSRSVLVQDDGGLAQQVLFELSGARLEIQGMDPIPIPLAAPNTDLRRDLLEPLGIRLVVNEQRLMVSHDGGRTLETAVARLHFDDQLIGGRPHRGEIAIGLTAASVRSCSAPRKTV